MKIGTFQRTMVTAHTDFVWRGVQLQAGNDNRLLPDDVLLEILDFYRWKGDPPYTAWDWELRVQVCRR